MAKHVLIGLLLSACLAPAQENLLPDPSVEETQPPNQFGVPYRRWNGWKFEGVCEFRNGKVARTGRTSAELVGGQGAKLRVYTPTVTVEPGRYRFACYLRGLDIGRHAWGLSEDLCFADDQYYPLKLAGTFGWTRVELVKQVTARREVVARLGLWAPGRLWVDDAEIVRVPETTPVTPAPVIGTAEQPIEPPGALDPAQAVACLDCGYRNLPAWRTCYACGATLGAAPAAQTGPAVKELCSFEAGRPAPFAEGTVVTEHATDGRCALRVDRNWSSWDGPQDWTGYDYLVVDVYNAGDEPQPVGFEVRDAQTRDYWTRVNYTSVAPPGASILRMPTEIYVGEKSRPGRMLDRAAVRRLVLVVGEAKAPLYFDRVRLERDLLADQVKVPGLRAFAFGPGTNAAVRGFERVTPATSYSVGRGFGFQDARLWRAFDVLQPDPLYQAFICVEAGSFRVDLPDGRYRVFCNLDSPSGFWGEVQKYRRRTVKANGQLVVNDSMDRESFARRYYRFADTEDRLDENTFDKYQRAYFAEKEFEVEVTGGKLALEFAGENWAHCLSALVVYPAAQADAGAQWLANLRERRRFWFDNYFKRVAPNGRRDAHGPIPELTPTAAEQTAGCVVFSRDWMQEVPCNAVPRRPEVTDRLEVFASAGQQEPVVFSVYPLRDLGVATVSVSELVGPAGRVPPEAVALGVVSHRVSRVTMEGTVYTIAPRYVLPRATAELRRGTTTTFWLTLHVPPKVAAGTYTGTITLKLADGRTLPLAVSARLFAQPLDEADQPIGPWGCSIDLPWYRDDLGDYPRQMYRRCLAKMREHGITTFSGIPQIRLTGWRDGRPLLDFTVADEQMTDAQAAGFKLLVLNYGAGIGGFNNYFADPGAVQRSGLRDQRAFLSAVLGAVQEHARTAGWLPVAYNLCDEPLGYDLRRAAENARAWREAAPAGLLTTGATSVAAPRPDDPHLALACALGIADLNLHDEAAVRAIQAAGSQWAFYNGGNRFTFGTYFYKCVKEYGCRFRLSWHWNVAAGDPFYALDCREDDYSWYVTNARGELIPSVHFAQQIAPGIADYRYLLTLANRLAARPDHPAAAAGRQLIADKLAAFRLGQRDPDRLWASGEYRRFRRRLAEAIEALQ